MDRRDALRSLGAAAVAAAAMPSLAQEEHHHHDSGVKNQALINAASECVNKAEICQSHSQELLAQGDKSMAHCAKNSRQIVVVCAALRSLAAQDAPSLPKFANVAAAEVLSCEAGCHKGTGEHQACKKHQACKDCADACAACRAECAKIAVA